MTTYDPPANESEKQRRPAQAVAAAILAGFNKHYRIFLETCRAAKIRFDRGDWVAIQNATQERIDFYDRRVLEAAETIAREFQIDALEDTVWRDIKLCYIGLLTDHRQPECAETFFNSVCSKLLHRSYFHNEYIFVRPGISTDHLDLDLGTPAYRVYYPSTEGLSESLTRVITNFQLESQFADLDRDIGYVIAAWGEHMPSGKELEPNYQIQVLGSLFFRNKGAYVVGRVINGGQQKGFVIPILHNDEGKLYLDTILLTIDTLNVFFSANRAYFLVDMGVPSAYVEFLRNLIPNKPKWELYTIVGLQKHGKNLFYRDFLHHLRHSGDEFIIAPGIPGLVMVVFTLPSYPYVFKVIRDRILPPKEVDRETVKAKYWLVKHHDRVGRMADTLEYSDVAFPKYRFSETLLSELKKLVPSIIEEDENTVFIEHLYIERRMIPLNIYLDRATPEEKRKVVQEYGLAIKQLAAANIFASDPLFKNFGISRFGRVVFYDYDEIDYLTHYNFRRMPVPRTEEEELSAEMWYTVEPNDVFPEEFEKFLLVDAQVRESFMKHHADLLDPIAWQNIQKRIAAGIVEDIFPYQQAIRFCNRYIAPATGPNKPKQSGEETSAAVSSVKTGSLDEAAELLK